MEPKSVGTGLFGLISIPFLFSWNFCPSSIVHVIQFTKSADQILVEGYRPVKETQVGCKTKA